MSGVKCKYHCSPCDRHFHSIQAFDLHIRRDQDFKGDKRDAPSVGCYSPGHSEEIKDEFIAFAGTCDICAGDVREGEIWEKKSRQGNVRTSKG